MGFRCKRCPNTIPYMGICPRCERRTHEKSATELLEQARDK
ncbi:hypothetical protein LCGC14_0586460 [marine sediment metagenome]|uniref:Uncharacterized protein n=1 Tax=marine sediment metagenome TaxID=412755 RepID=A0A0F9REW5_9ZZZZ